MFRPFLALTAAVLLLSAGAPVDAQDLLLRRLTYAQSLVLRAFGEYFESLRVQAGIPGLAASIIGPDEIIWEHSFGRQDNERSIAARIDTPFHLDGLTQVFTTTLVMRCVEEGRLSLDDRLGKFQPDGPDANATIQQVLTHTSGPPDALVFAYRPERFESLAPAISECRGESFREALANQLDRLAMFDSVPGADILAPPALLAEDFLTPVDLQRYGSALERLAVPYSVNTRGQASRSQYAAPALTPWKGLISTVRDFGQFDLALKKGVLLQEETVADLWRAPVGIGGARLPHGLGWFVQIYNGEPIMWQFGLGMNSSSSLVVNLPRRGVTMVLLANSDGLVRPFSLAAGSVTASPFVRLFLGLVVR